ncbi:MAG: hypothetical protein M1817_000655 [Caeruleum heppii]|nr:MAG: hypothetical protein M1817_000655 [Caeruleum heppii]
MSTTTAMNPPSKSTRQRRFSRPNSISSSSVVTVISRTRSPDTTGSRPSTSPPLARNVWTTTESTRGGNASTSPERKRRSSFAYGGSNSAAGLTEGNPNLNRWSQSTASSAASSGHARRSSLSKRLSLAGSSPFGSWGGSTNSQSPPRNFLTKTRSPSHRVSPHSQPLTAQSPPRKQSSSEQSPQKQPVKNSPSRNFLTKTRLSSAGSLRRPPVPALNPPPVSGHPSLTLPSLTQAVNESESPMVTAAGTPVTADLLPPSAFAPPSRDYFGEVWQDDAGSKHRPSVHRTTTAPVHLHATSSGDQSSNGMSLPHLVPSDATPSSHSDSNLSGEPSVRKHSSARSRSERGAGGHTESSSSASSFKSRERHNRGDRAPSQKAQLSKALQKANTAVLLDNAQNFEGAIEAYSHACMLLQQVMKRSPGNEDRRKLEAIRNTYTNRITELRGVPWLGQGESKALPARPESDYKDRDSSGSLLISASGAVVYEMTQSSRRGSEQRVEINVNDTYTTASPIQRRRGSLAPSPFEKADSPIESISPSKKSNHQRVWSRTSAKERALDTTFHLPIPNEADNVPPPLSPRYPSTPLGASPLVSGRTSPTNGSLDPHQSQAPQPRQRSRADSTESTSWLDTIDESGGSSGSSVHSRSSSMGLRRKRIRAASGATEAEFDAALDAAVEAAYNDGLEPAEEDEAEEPFVVSNARRNVEMAKERVREAEREAAIEAAREKEKLRMMKSSHNRSDSIDLEYDDEEAEEEERMLEEMTRGYVMDDSEFDLQSKSALPRQSDSSGFSGRTWGSSTGSNPATASTSLQTLAEAPTLPSLPSVLSRSPPLHAPPPANALPAPPDLAAVQEHTSAPRESPDLQSSARLPPTVRSRRLSGRLSGHYFKPLKIETSARVPSGAEAPLTEPADRPAPGGADDAYSRPPPMTAGVVPTPEMIAGSLLRAQATMVPHSSLRENASPVPDPMSAETKTSFSPATPALSKTISHDSDVGNVSTSGPNSPGHWSGKGSRATDYLRKIQSSSSLKNRNLAVSSPEESDPSPTTPLSTTFSQASTLQTKGLHPAVPALPTPSAAVFGSTSTTGPNSLFDSGIHLLDRPGVPNTLALNAPVALEPCPIDTILRPFWLMRCLYQTIAHPRGGYLSTKLFVPAEVWRVKGIKIKGLEEKISHCDFLTAALLKLGKVDSCDADALLEEMQSLELVLDQVQTALTKKLGSDVGVQGASASLKDAQLNGEGAVSHEPVPGKSSSTSKSYLSWKRLRSKNSGAGLTNAFAGPKEASKEGLTLSSLPMTSTPSIKPPKRDVNQIQFAGPNAMYMSALTRLFDAAQALDQIARQVEDPGLKHSSPTHVGLELSTRHAAEFFAFYICRPVLGDLSMMIDKFLKRAGEWILV